MKQHNELNVFLALLLMMGIVAFIKPNVFFQAYSLNLWVFSLSLFGLLAIGETFVVLTGGIDLSPGSMIALTGVICALLVKWLWLGVGMDPLLASSAAIALTLILGIAIGLFHAFYINRLRVPPFIITLGTLIIARGVAELITHGSTISGLPDSFKAIGANGSAFVLFRWLPLAGVIFAVFAIVAHQIMSRSKLGRHIYAVGGNEEAARLSGVNVEGVRAFCYAASAFMAALGGILYASSVTIGDPKAGSAYELTAIAAVVIGGTSLMGGVGTMMGTVLGAAIMSLLPLGLTYLGVQSWWQSISTGIVVVLAVTLDSLRTMQRQRKR